MKANLDNIVVLEERIFPEVSLTIGQVVYSPADELTSLMDTNGLTAGQVAYCKDFRRKERNKLSVRRLRKRKLDKVVELTEKLRQAVAVEVAMNALKEEKLEECRQLSKRTNEVIVQCLQRLQLDSRIYTMEVRDGCWRYIELWSQRVLTEDELQEMQL